MPAYIGELPNMWYDTVRQRYFPGVRPIFEDESTGEPSRSSSHRGTRYMVFEADRDSKAKRKLSWSDAGIITAAYPALCAAKTAKPVKHKISSLSLPRQRLGHFRRNKAAREDSHGRNLIRDLTHEVTERPVICEDEAITSYTSFAGGAYLASTDHGRVTVRTADSTLTDYAVCNNKLMHVHLDVPRMSYMSVSEAESPHVHFFRRDPDYPDVEGDATTCELPRGDLFTAHSFDGQCALGRKESLLTVFTTDNEVRFTRRRFASDVMAVNHENRNLIWAGTRSGGVFLDDQRVWGNAARRTLFRLTADKAVVGVKRLEDGAVPWGVLVSAMKHELAIFDARYGGRPLMELDGHINHFLSGLGLCTTPDDRFVFAAGSDRMIRAWSTLDGKRVEPVMPKTRLEPQGPLETKLAARVNTLAFRPDDWALDVVLQGEVRRYHRFEQPQIDFLGWLSD